MFTPASELPTYVRVKDKATKHEFSVPESTFDAEHMERLDKAATYPNGTPLEPKHHIELKSLSSTASPVEPATTPAARTGRSTDKE